MSKTIGKHDCVKLVEKAVGGDEGRKYEVLLHWGWHFLMLDGQDRYSRPDNPNFRRWAMFSSVKEFKDAMPERIVSIPYSERFND